MAWLRARVHGRAAAAISTRIGCGAPRNRTAAKKIGKRVAELADGDVALKGPARALTTRSAGRALLGWPSRRGAMRMAPARRSWYGERSGKTPRAASRCARLACMEHIQREHRFPRDGRSRNDVWRRVLARHCAPCPHESRCASATSSRAVRQALAAASKGQLSVGCRRLVARGDSRGAPGG